MDSIIGAVTDLDLLFEPGRMSGSKSTNNETKNYKCLIVNNSQFRNQKCPKVVQEMIYEI